MRARVFYPTEQRAKSVSLVRPLPPLQNALSFREFPLSPKHLPHVQRDRAKQIIRAAQPPHAPGAVGWDLLWVGPQPRVGSTEEASTSGNATFEEGLLCLA